MVSGQAVPSFFWYQSIQFYMPRKPGTAWELIEDSTDPEGSGKAIVPAGDCLDLVPRSTAVLRELTD